MNLSLANSNSRVRVTVNGPRRTVGPDCMVTVSVSVSYSTVAIVIERHPFVDRNGYAAASECDD